MTVGHVPVGHVCARCPKRLGASCCEVQPHERLATLTWPDVARLTATTGLKPQAFSEWEWLGPAEVQAWLDVHPAYAGYLAAEPRRLTLKATSGACVFLDRVTGCRLKAEDRPTACQLYPFDTGGRLQVERFGAIDKARAVVERGTANACLAVEESASLEALHRAFDTTRRQVRALSERLRAEVAAHAAIERKQKAKRRGR